MRETTEIIIDSESISQKRRLSLLLALTVNRLSSERTTFLTAVTEAGMFLKIWSFLAVQIAQHKRITKIMKNWLLTRDLTSRMASGNCESWFRKMLKQLQQLLAKGQSRKRCVTDSSTLSWQRTQLYEYRYMLFLLRIFLVLPVLKK